MPGIVHLTQTEDISVCFYRTVEGGNLTGWPALRVSNMNCYPLLALVLSKLSFKAPLPQTIATLRPSEITIPELPLPVIQASVSAAPPMHSTPAHTGRKEAESSQRSSVQQEEDAVMVMTVWA